MAAMIAGISTVAYLPPRATQVVKGEGEENEEVEGEK